MNLSKTFLLILISQIIISSKVYGLAPANQAAKQTEGSGQPSGEGNNNQNNLEISNLGGSTSAGNNVTDPVKTLVDQKLSLGITSDKNVNEAIKLNQIIIQTSAELEIQKKSLSEVQDKIKELQKNTTLTVEQKTELADLRSKENKIIDDANNLADKEEQAQNNLKGLVTSERTLFAQRQVLQNEFDEKKKAADDLAKEEASLKQKIAEFEKNEDSREITEAEKKEADIFFKNLEEVKIYNQPDISSYFLRKPEFSKAQIKYLEKRRKDYAAQELIDAAARIKKIDESLWPYELRLKEALSTVDIFGKQLKDLKSKSARTAEEENTVAGLEYMIAFYTNLIEQSSGFRSDAEKDKRAKETLKNEARARTKSISHVREGTPKELINLKKSLELISGKKSKTSQELTTAEANLNKVPDKKYYLATINDESKKENKEFKKIDDNIKSIASQQGLTKEDYLKKLESSKEKEDIALLAKYKAQLETSIVANEAKDTVKQADKGYTKPKFTKVLKSELEFDGTQVYTDLAKFTPNYQQPPTRNFNGTITVNNMPNRDPVADNKTYKSKFNLSNTKQ